MPFSDVVGHARPLALLTRSLVRGTLPPSLLFTGPAGVGKKVVARAVAEVLNCTAGSAAPGGAPRLDACGVCSSCRRIAKLTHPDVISIEPEEARATGIELVRQAIEATAYRPFEGRARVVIVDAADLLTIPAQNALLKSLEEPAAGSVFILVTSRPETLLATIRSRCSRLRFGRLAAADVARLLTERHAIDPSEAHAMAAISDGSPGRALAVGTRAFRDARDATLTLLGAVARASSARVRLQAAGAWSGGKASSAGEREDLATRIRLLTALLRDLSLLAVADPALGMANADLAGELASLSADYDANRAVRAFASADRALAALRQNASPKIVAGWLATRL